MKNIELTQGKFAIVDDEDFDFLNQWKWAAAKRRNTWYAIRTDCSLGKMNSKSILMHRLIMSAGKGKLIDHKDQFGLNNQKINLRESTHSQNSANRKAYKNSTSKYLGVGWNKEKKKWQAQITINYRRIHLGYFNQEEEAANVYNIKALEFFGEFSMLNKI